MRISVDILARGYDRERLHRARCSLDGVEQNLAVVADEEAGYIIRYKTIDGRPIVHGDELARETVYGKVAIWFNPAV